MSNGRWVNVVALCTVFVLLSLAAPVFAAEPEPQNCREACEMAGVPDIGQCVTDCEEFTMRGAGGGEQGFMCYYHLVRDCGSSTLGIKALIYMIIDCAEDDFKKSCFKKGFCDASESCIKDVCECGQHSVSKGKCLKEWKKVCR
jgi:hypothetical protein